VDAPTLRAEIERLDQVWQAMPRGTPAEKAASQAFYGGQIFPLIREEFALREAARVTQAYDLAVMTAGGSPEALVLSLSALRPAKIFFLHTAWQQSLDGVDQVVRDAQPVQVVPRQGGAAVLVAAGGGAGLVVEVVVPPDRPRHQGLLAREAGCVGQLVHGGQDLGQVLGGVVAPMRLGPPAQQQGALRQPQVAPRLGGQGGGVGQPPVQEELGVGGCLVHARHSAIIAG